MNSSPKNIFGFSLCALGLGIIGFNLQPPQSFIQLPQIEEVHAAASAYNKLTACKKSYHVINSSTLGPSGGTTHSAPNDGKTWYKSAPSIQGKFDAGWKSGAPTPISKDEYDKDPLKYPKSDYCRF